MKPFINSLADSENASLYANMLTSILAALCKDIEGAWKDTPLYF